MHVSGAMLSIKCMFCVGGSRDAVEIAIIAMPEIKYNYTNTLKIWNILPESVIQASNNSTCGRD